MPLRGMLAYRHFWLFPHWFSRPAPLPLYVTSICVTFSSHKGRDVGQSGFLPVLEVCALPSSWSGTRTTRESKIQEMEIVTERSPNMEQLILACYVGLIILKLTPLMRRLLLGGRGVSVSMLAWSGEVERRGYGCKLAPFCHIAAGKQKNVPSQTS